MRFYDALQLDPSCLKQKIRGADLPKERRKLLAAMTARSFLIVLFAIVVISPVSPVFGAENSPMAVAMFCILLGLRFVDFGYCIKDSLINLAVVFLLLLAAPVAAANSPLIFAALIHFTAFFIILFMTSDQPEMGNAGIYTFAYIYLSGNPVTGSLLWKRALLTLVGYVLCAAILLMKHRKKNPTVRFRDMVAQFRLSNKKTQWQIQLALGVGVILALGSFFNLARMMWAAFACGSILGCYSATITETRERFIQRMIGTLAGSLIFLVVYPLIPEALRPLLGPMGGICLGFCTDYRYKTASNCIGALFMATSIYGLQGSVFLRVMNNLLGVIFGFTFWLLYQKLMHIHFGPTASNNAENPAM